MKRIPGSAPRALSGWRLALQVLAVLALPAGTACADGILLYPPAGQQPASGPDAVTSGPVRPPVTPPGYQPPAAAPAAPVPATVPATAAAAGTPDDDLNAVKQVLQQLEQQGRQNPDDPAYQQAISELRQLEQQLLEQGGSTSQASTPFPGAAP